MADNLTPEDLEKLERRETSKMIDETDIEIMNDAFDKKDEELPEDDGDKALEQPENSIFGDELQDENDQDEQDQQDDEDQVDGGDEDEGGEEPEIQEPQRDERSERFVPSGRLREERTRADEAERQLAEMRARLDSIERTQRPQQPQPPPPAKPDMFVDPDAHDEYLIQQMLQRQHHMRQEASMQEAKEEHGEDFDYAYGILQAAVRRGDPTAHQIVTAVYGSANPGRAFMRWAQPLLDQRADQQEEQLDRMLQERYGTSLADLDRRAQRSSQGQPRPQQSSPRRGVPSLNSAGGSGGQRQRIDPRGMDGSEEAIFNDVFEPPRR